MVDLGFFSMGHVLIHLRQEEMLNYIKIKIGLCPNLALRIADNAQSDFYQTDVWHFGVEPSQS